MRTVWVALLLAAGLAGCADGGEAEPEPEAFTGVQASSDTGVIRDVVVDETITPVEGVKVALSPAAVETVSDAEGAFVFEDLEPGVYFLQASSPGFTDIQASAEVEAGVEKPPVVRIQVERIPIPDPFVQPFVWEAFMDTSASVAGTGVVAGGFTGQGSFGARHDLPANASWVQSELVWNAEHPLADTMQTDARLYGGGEDPVFDRQIGTSPLLQIFDNATVHADTEQVGYTLFVEDSSLVPVGMTAQQRLTMFTHSFHHFLPEDGWRFSEDGEPDVPDS